MSRLWEVHEFHGVRYAARYPEAGELEDALRKLRASPVLDPRAAVRIG